MKIVILGTGNVASQLANALKIAGHDLLQVYGRNKEAAYKLSKQHNTTFTDDLKKINTKADIYIIAVADAAIPTIVKKLALKNQVIVHTSGSISLDVFKNNYTNCGVLYPVQTISKNGKTNFRTTPFGIEASNTKSLKVLEMIAKSLSANVFHINSDQRKTLHLAAVFANNFTNHLLTIAEKILSNKNLPFDLLKALIEETVKKIRTHSPASVQTGPAERKDSVTLEKHLKMLEKNPLYKKIYIAISESIQESK